MAGAVALAAALAERQGPGAVAERAARSALRDRLEREAGLPVASAGAPRLPGHALLLAGVRGDLVVHQLDGDGICVAAGSACAAGSAEPSYVLAAMGIDPATARGAVRVTLGPESAAAEIDAFLGGARIRSRRPPPRGRERRVIDLSRAGAVERPDGEGRAGGGACDDRVRFTVALDRGQLVAVRFGADACPTTTAAAAWLATEAEGRSLLDAARLGAVAAHAACGVAGARRACAEVAVDAFHAALGDAVVRGATVPGTGRLAVAMSGGVDSAVALAEAPADAFGITLQLWIDPHAPDTDRACCAPGSVRRARDLCHQRGLPHLSLDLRDTFRDTIVAGFIAGYEAGETPNPCTACNGEFRLHELVAAAGRLGAGRVRTGHYARIVERDGVPLVARGVDSSKDQSYMLARVPTDVLARLDFPLGERTKPEVRERAAELGLAAAHAKESQEVCFLGGGDYRTFLDRYGAARTAGPIRGRGRPRARPPRRGRRLHAGPAPRHRRVGAGAALRAPHRADPQCRRRGAAAAPRDASRAAARRRDARRAPPGRREAPYRSPAVAASLEGDGSERKLELERDLFAIAPGQTAALYDGDAVVGCGTIA